MQCLSCQCEIDPKWKHAIEINVCPLCGNTVMEQHLKELLTSLRDTMDKLQQYPDQLNDWMLSNYQFIKTDSPLLSQYLPKGYAKPKEKEVNDPNAAPEIRTIKMRDGTETQVIVEKAMSDDRAQSFQDRANDKKGKSVKGKILPGLEEPKSIPDKTRDLKKLKRQIEEEAATGVISQNSLANMIKEDTVGGGNMLVGEASELSPEEVQAMQMEINGGLPLPNSDGLSDGFNAGEDESSMANKVLAMNLQAKQSSGSNVNKDAEYLRAHQTAVMDAQKRLGDGPFSRGS